MTDETRLRERLTRERERVVQQIAQLTHDYDAIVATAEGASVDDEHDPEGATIGFERAQVRALLDHARAQLDALDDALARLDAGNYGSSLSCGAPIGAERLAARPATQTCIVCASRPR